MIHIKEDVPKSTIFVTILAWETDLVSEDYIIIFSFARAGSWWGEQENIPRVTYKMFSINSLSYSDKFSPLM